MIVNTPTKKSLRLILLACLFTGFFLICPFFLSMTIAQEWSGYVGVEGRLFFADPLHPDQRDQNGSLVAQPEFFHQWDEYSVTAVPFFRFDSADAERSHFDIRELFVLWVPESFELGFGFRKIFWGVTESQHLLDIINQTDLVELPDGEEKLGQPMINLSVLRDWGMVDLFLLPYFRERTFPGPKGRLRGALVVDTDQARFESGAENHHFDIAARYSLTLDNWDLALSHFQGTGREPTLLPGTDTAGNTVLIPFYEQIDQSGLALQSVIDAWLLKLELIHRRGQGEAFEAWTSGIEYTYSALVGSKADLGIIAEWLHDTRGEKATTPFEDDMMIGLRLALNDMDSTEFLVGLIQDLDHSARVLSLEANRRFGDRWLMSIEGSVFSAQSQGELLYAQRDDDFMHVSLSYYF